MPLFKEWSIDEHTLAAIWKIEEPEDFFISHTGLEPDIKNEKRRMEYLAGRFLLRHLKDDFPLFEIKPDEHDKPRIDNNALFFSISHSWPYIAAVVSMYKETGIDIQTWHGNIDRIQHKFLAPDELEITTQNPKMITLAWCAKEAVYKWQGKRGTEFIEHLPIVSFDKMKELYNINIYYKLPIPPQMITLEGLIHEDFACVYVINAMDWAIY